MQGQFPKSAIPHAWINSLKPFRKEDAEIVVGAKAPDMVKKAAFLQLKITCSKSPNLLLPS